MHKLTTLPSSIESPSSDGCATKNADRVAATYLDSSSIVELAVREAESDALPSHLRRRRPLVSSALARTGRCSQAVRRHWSPDAESSPESTSCVSTTES